MVIIQLILQLEKQKLTGVRAFHYASYVVHHQAELRIHASLAPEPIFGFTELCCLTVSSKTHREALNLDI